MIRRFYTLTAMLIFMLTRTYASSNESPPIVGVYCSADDKVSQTFKTVANQLGKSLAQSNFALMTGASKTGLMKEVNDGYASSMTHPDHLHGSLPSIFKDFDVHHAAIPVQNLTWTDTVHERLSFFLKKCDSVIVLPGGFGTLHELMDTLVHQQFGLTHKKIILFNVEGFWDPLILLFDKMVEQKTLDPKHRDHLKIVTDIETCLDALSINMIDDNKGLENRFWEKEGSTTSQST